MCAAKPITTEANLTTLDLPNPMQQTIEQLMWIPEKIAGPTSEKIAGPEVSRNEFFSKMKESSNKDLAVCSVRWRDS